MFFWDACHMRRSPRLLHALFAAIVSPVYFHYFSRHIFFSFFAIAFDAYDILLCLLYLLCFRVIAFA